GLLGTLVESSVIQGKHISQLIQTLLHFQHVVSAVSLLQLTVRGALRRRAFRLGRGGRSRSRLGRRSGGGFCLRGFRGGRRLGGFRTGFILGRIGLQQLRMSKTGHLGNSRNNTASLPL